MIVTLFPFFREVVIASSMAWRASPAAFLVMFALCEAILIRSPFVITWVVINKSKTIIFRPVAPTRKLCIYSDKIACHVCLKLFCLALTKVPQYKYVRWRHTNFMSAKNLVIVESPGKIKTISKFLGEDYTVMASMGHVRDLPKSKMGIDIKHNFEPTYLISREKSKVVKDIKSKIGKNTTVWVATDEDREGEAIGWHLLEALDLDEKKDDVKRIVFHEITKPAILAAIENPRHVNTKLVEAQQARRILDRLVGYELSPLLWKKVKYGLSAGRVQSVAVRLIVEREREIQVFKPEEYWSLTAKFLSEKKEEFTAKLTKRGGENFVPKNQEESDKVLSDLENADYKVTAIDKKETRRNPAPPFITSTLQQEAARKLGFSVKKTMMVAQKLYEGVEIDGSHEGLITYMRTDSVNVSQQALAQAKVVITSEFGKEYALETPRFYKGRKGAQEAHEAIRPADLSRTPISIKNYLGKDEFRLYELIWKRMLACQMEAAILDKVGVDISARDYIFRATGQTVKFAGFMKVYMESHDSAEEDDEDKENILPELRDGEEVGLRELLPEQHFTKPPARYTEASLVKKLEAEGIGRPSTYAPTISTIQARGYILKEGQALMPAEIGMIVNDLLVEHFPKIVDYQFTVKMEDMLDGIEDGKEAWQEEIREFYMPFHELVEAKMKDLTKEDVVNETTTEICEKCGKPMMVKFGRFGKFLSCSGFPECKNAKPFDNPNAPAKKEAVKIGVTCPICKTGELVERVTRKRGKVFYGCNRFPKCKFAVWDKPKDSGDALRLKKESEDRRAEKMKGKSKKR